MRGSTRKRGSTWTAYWDIGEDPTTGGRRQKSKGGFRTQKDAQRFLNTTLTSVATGTYAEPSAEPLARFLTGEWLPAVKRTVRPLTHRRYESLVRTYVSGRDIGAVPLRALSAGHLNALYGDLEREGLSIATRRLVHAVLRRALGDAVRWDKLTRNPATQADPPAQPRSRAQSWTAAELRRFLEHVTDDRLFALWRLASTVPTRRGELLGTTWRALDLDGATLGIDQQVIPNPDVCPVCGDKHSVSFGPPKTHRGERTVALDPRTLAALREHRERQLLERDLAGPAYVDHDLVFCDELGAPIHPQRLTEWFPKLRKAAGLTTGSTHILRHTVITLALTAGVPIHVVAARAGDRPEQILSTYAHLLPHSDKLAAVAVAALVDNPLTSDAAINGVEPMNRAYG